MSPFEKWTGVRDSKYEDIKIASFSLKQMAENLKRVQLNLKLFVENKLERGEFWGNSLRKHAYSNILTILPPKTERFQIKILICFHISAQT